MQKTPFLISLLILLFLGSSVHGQCKLILEYDEAGNRVFRGHGSDGPADLTVSMTLLPTNIEGPTTIFFDIDVLEIAGNCALGDITVIFPVDPKLTFTYDPSLINYGPFPLDNPSWEHDTSNSSFHLFKNNKSINSSSSSNFGFEAVYDPEGASGRTSFTFTIIVGSGGEDNGNNNIDSETLYFQSD